MLLDNCVFPILKTISSDIEKGIPARLVEVCKQAFVKLCTKPIELAGAAIVLVFKPVIKLVVDGLREIEDIGAI
jgi:hypothetical protein